MKFCDKDFLLSNDAARKLYHDTAAGQPIIDYHCHLSPRDLAENRQFQNLQEAWLEGDHYKWRAMRANGVPEQLITGADATPREKFQAWAGTVPRTLRNPQFHWTHLELRRYFGIETLLEPASAQTIWDEANRLLAQPGYSVRGLVERMKVEVICTTDDPADNLEHHRAIAKSGWRVKVLPAFRPDNAMRVGAPERFQPWVKRLGEASGAGADTFKGFLKAISKRHDFFHSRGCRLSDHGLERMPALDCAEKKAAAIFAAALKGKAASPEDTERFASFMMEFFGLLDAGKGWTKQLHLGALRDPNARLGARLGSDAGTDAIGDFPQGNALRATWAGSTGMTSSPKSSSTTSTPRTLTCSPAWSAVSRTVRSPANCSTAPRGGSSTRKTASARNSTPCPISACSAGSSACSPIRAPSSPIPATNISAASFAI